MDIHKPKHPIDSLREFLVEIFTVTVGIVIALSLEALIVAHHNADLGRQAQNGFAVELAANRARLDEVLQSSPGDEALLLSMIGYVAARLAHQDAKSPVQGMVRRRFATLTSDAWQTALATQAIGQISFPQVRALSLVYDQQAVFNDMEARAREEWFGIAAFDETSAMSDDDLRSEMKLLRVAYAYQISLATVGKGMASNYTEAEAALKQR